MLGLVAVISLAMGSYWLYQRYRVAPEIDFPAMELSDLQGEPVDFSNRHAGRVFLVFWASWCPDCLEEWPHVMEAAYEFRYEEIDFVMISDEDLETINDFLANRDPYVVRFYKLNGRSRDLKIYSIPTVYLLDQGKVVDAQVGNFEWSSQEGLDRIRQAFKL